MPHPGDIPEEAEAREFGVLLDFAKIKNPAVTTDKLQPTSNSRHRTTGPFFNVFSFSECLLLKKRFSGGGILHSRQNVPLSEVTPEFLHRAATLAALAAAKTSASTTATK